MDDGRFERVWHAHGASVLRYCTYSTGSRDAGEDLAAEAFARFLSKGDRVSDEFAEAWLIRVARNLCASHHRDVARRRRLTGLIAQSTESRVQEWTHSDAWEYVRKLNETERLAIYLRVAEERSFAEVARILGKSESAAKMTFYRAIERVRRDMHRAGAEESSLVGGAEGV